MSLNSSLHKSVTSFSLLFIGAMGSLLTAPILLANPPQVEQSVTQLIDSSTNIPEVVEEVGEARIVLGLLAVGGAVGVVGATKAKNHFPSSPSSSYKSKESTIRIEQASRELQRKLLRLLHNDPDTANRLLSQVKMKNPNRSINWYVEKVIYDLERDRGRY